jgi:toxin ParE1/3/4
MNVSGRRRRFYDAVMASVDRAAAQPEMGVAARRGPPGTRRLLIERFPYSMVYLVHNGVLHVLAVAHAKRRPGYWRSRRPS